VAAADAAAVVVDVVVPVGCDVVQGIRLVIHGRRRVAAARRETSLRSRIRVTLESRLIEFRVRSGSAGSLGQCRPHGFRPPSSDCIPVAIRHRLFSSETDIVLRRWRFERTGDASRSCRSTTL
jgi:hypothetical protein